MHPTEAIAWSRHAAPVALAAIREQADLARDVWSKRMGWPFELRDVAPWSLGGWFSPDGAIAAACEIAVELEIIVRIWPDRPCDVLRASWQ